MLFGYSTTCCECILQSFSEGDEAFSALNNLGILPAALSQSIVIEQMLKRLASNGYFYPFELGKV